MPKDEQNPTCPVAPCRRSALLGLAAGLVAPSVSWAAAPSARSIALVNINTGERFRGAYWERGRYLPDALGELDRLFRDHRTERARPIDPKLFDVLAELRRRLEAGADIHLVSAYRSPETNAAARRKSRNVARNSLHMHGQAADIRVPGCGVGAVRRAAIALKSGGVGAYPGANYVHLDTGPVRTW